jgi:hypothetical protein
LPRIPISCCGYRLLDIGDMRGVENGQRGIRMRPWMNRAAATGVA